MDKPWETIRSEPGPDLTLFQARFDWVSNPRNASVMRAVVLELRDFVNVVAVTPEERIVVVKQYRFGAQKVTTEIPAGLMEPGESHAETVVRELREETGYTAAQWRYLGWSEPNPAFLNNICHQWLALDAVRTGAPTPDESEEISVAELTLEELKDEIKAGRMRNSLTLLSLMRVFDLRGEW